MPCVCKGLCLDKKWVSQFKTNMGGKNAYSKGYLRCRGCAIFYMGLRLCPCCQGLLANMPRNSKSKRLITDQLERY